MLDTANFILCILLDDIKVIHRIIDQKLMGEETRYYTKGDANQKQDDLLLKLRI